MADITAAFGTFPTPKSPIMARLADTWQELRRHRAERRLFRRTHAELSRMTDRELADVGISRFQIADVALEAARSR